MIQRIQNSKWVFVLISVFLAVIFWMYVRNDLDPPGSRTIYNVPVTLTGETILESQGLTITAVSDTAVDLKITAPISILNKLSNRNLSVTVNVSQCTEGEQILQYDVNWPRDVSTAEITKESQEPAAITVMVARLYSKTFEIQPVLKASIAPGYQAGQITISPETVTISGSEEAVSRVAKVEAVLEGEELNTRFSGNVPLVLLDAEGNELTDLEINMDTDTTYVTMPVYVVKEVKLTVDYTPGGGATGEDVTSAIIFPDSITIAGSEEDVSNMPVYVVKEVKLTVDYTPGGGATGEDVTSAIIFPDSITIAGSEEDVSKVEEISLGSIDLSKVVGTNSFTLPIELDSSLENVSGITEAVVTVTISGLSTRTFNVTNMSKVVGTNSFTLPIELDSSLENVSGITEAVVTVTISGLSTRTFNVTNIDYDNAPEGYHVEVATESCSVVVRGSEERLEDISASQLRIVADLSNVMTVGSVSVPARVYLDYNSEVGVIGEYSVVVNISR